MQKPKVVVSDALKARLDRYQLEMITERQTRDVSLSDVIEALADEHDARVGAGA